MNRCKLLYVELKVDKWFRFIKISLGAVGSEKMSQHSAYYYWKVFPVDVGSATKVSYVREKRN